MSLPISSITPELKAESKRSRSLVDLDAVKKKMDYTFRNGKEKGEITHFPPIDSKRCFTWKKGTLVVVTGYPGSGKSEFINQLALLKSINDGWKWDMYSPESYPPGDLLDTFIHSFIGKTTDPDYTSQMSKEEYDRGFETIRKYFFLLDFEEVPTVDDVLGAAASDCDGLIIDPFNSLAQDKDNLHDFLKYNLTKIKKFAVDKNKVVVIIEHPNSSISFDDKGAPREPDQFSINGGRMWHNKADMFAVVHRPYAHNEMGTPDSRITRFRTRKIKNQKLNGVPNEVEFTFNPVTNKYEWKSIDIDDCPF